MDFLEVHGLYKGGDKPVGLANPHFGEHVLQYY